MTIPTDIERSNLERSGSMGSETVKYVPRRFTWHGKYPVVNGTTDWLGTIPSISQGVAEDSFKSIHNIPVGEVQGSFESIDQLQRTAFGLISPGIKSLVCTTLLREDNLEAYISDGQHSGAMNRPMDITESYDYGLKRGDTHSLIDSGYSWLDPARKRHVMVSTSYLARISPEKQAELRNTFEIVVFDLPPNYDQDKTTKEIPQILEFGSTEILKIPGAIRNKNEWLRNTALIAKVVAHIAEDPDNWPPTKRPLIVYDRLGETPNQQYQMALDLIEVVSILRGEPLRYWSTSPLLLETARDDVPSVLVVDPNKTEQRHLNKLGNVRIVDDSPIDELKQANSSRVEMVVKEYLRETTPLSKVRHEIKKILS